MLISSKVSTQSEEKPGQITSIFFFPFLGKASNVLGLESTAGLAWPGLAWPGLA